MNQRINVHMAQGIISPSHNFCGDAERLWIGVQKR